MLSHLAITLHPGVLGDCFYQPDTALCAKRARPTRHRAPADAEHLPDLPERAPFQRSPAPPGTSPRPGPADHRRDAGGTLPPLQQAALTSHLSQLGQLISQITSNDTETTPAVTIDEKIQAAYDTLTAGRPAVTDGQLTVSDICLEAGISRASFYRSPLATQIRRRPRRPRQHRRPEAEQLRVKVRELTAADKQLRSKHATEIRDLRATVRTYANQIQLLTLHLSQLEDDNNQLTARLQHAVRQHHPAEPALTHDASTRRLNYRETPAASGDARK